MSVHAGFSLLHTHLTTVGYSSAVYTYTMVKEAARENFPITAITVTTTGYSGEKAVGVEIKRINVLLSP